MSLKGYRLEHCPTGRSGICTDWWIDPKQGERVRIYPRMDGPGFNCDAGECRVLPWQFYLITVNGRRVA